MRRGCVVSLAMGMLAITAVWQSHAAGADAPLAVLPTFQQANERYRSGQFEEAASAYRRILESGQENGALYYDLGNALLKSGKISEALWAYLRAKAFLPRDADVQANLAYVQSLLQPGVNASVKASRLVQWLSFHQRFATAELTGWSVVSLWGFVLVWSLSTWRPQARRVARPLARLFSLIAAAFLIALWVQTVWVDGVPKAVIVRDQVEVKFSPQATGTTHFSLSDGTIVRVLRHEFGWVQLKRADGLSGWVSENTLSAL